MTQGDMLSAVEGGGQTTEQPAPRHGPRRRREEMRLRPNKRYVLAVGRKDQETYYH